MEETSTELASKGLTHEEAARRLKTDGFNELPSQKQRDGIFLLKNVLREPMLVMLVAIGGLYLLLGDTTDALMLSSFILFVVGITYYQEHKTEKALDALKNLSSPRALVIRGGGYYRIAGREVVRDDILSLKEGDRVPADGYVLSCSNLLVDESFLTGESAPVRKRSWDRREEVTHPGGDDAPFVYSGTLVIQGRATVRVFATGVNTQMGKIGLSLSTIAEEEMLLRRQTKRIVRNLAISGLFLSVVVVLLWGLTRGSWLDGALAGLTLSLSMLPEEFPVVLTIFLTLGAWRLSKRQVLTRHLSAIETLGAATVLCVDKTGTLTENRMQLAAFYTTQDHDAVEVQAEVEEKYHDLLFWGALASETEPFDPLEKELRQRAKDILAARSANHWLPVRDYPRTENLFAVSYIYQPPNQDVYLIATKGAPEAICALCNLEESVQVAIIEAVRAMAKSGLRVLGVAQATWGEHELPPKQAEFSFTFVGLVGFADPVRGGAAQAVAEAYQAGIRVIMLTGDYPVTAQAIAAEVKLTNPELFITGEELGAMNHLELREKIKSVNVFGRILPEQKLLLVNALKANGEIVAMTGDGINDAPALKAAHIGIAMGGRGTDVAREASDIVLVDDNFSSIVRAVRTGRKIYENIKKATSYILAVHVPIAGMAIVPILLGLPVVLMPAHIAFLELIIDPACSTVFEAEHGEADIMKKPPRSLHEPLFSGPTVAVGLLQGLSVLVIVFLVFIGSLTLGQSDTQARTLAFTTLVFGNLTLIVTNLSWKRTLLAVLHHATPVLRLILAGVTVVLTAVLYFPSLRSLFHFSRLGLIDLVIALGAGVASLLWFEILKTARILKT